MGMTDMKKSVASRIANSHSRFPASIQRWAARELNAIPRLAYDHDRHTSSKNSNSSTTTTTTTTTTSATTSATTPCSSATETTASTDPAHKSPQLALPLPLLELRLERTKINTRGCLKPTRDLENSRLQRRNLRYFRHSNYRLSGGGGGGGDDDEDDDDCLSAKHVAFVYDDVLLTCISTGLHILPAHKTPDSQQRFIERSEHRNQERATRKQAKREAREAACIKRAEDPACPAKKGEKSSSSSRNSNSNSNSNHDTDDEYDDNDDDDDDDDDDDNNIDDDRPRPDRDFIIGPLEADEQALEDRLTSARRASDAHEAQTMTGGGLDFALYVTRSDDSRRALERIALRLHHHHHYHHHPLHPPRQSHHHSHQPPPHLHHHSSSSRSRRRRHHQHPQQHPPQPPQRIKVGSYRGSERRYTRCGVAIATELSPDIYDDYRSSMSGCYPPVLAPNTSIAGTVLAPVAEAGDETSKDEEAKD